VAFKYNLPIPVLILILIVGAVAALVLFHSPPEEDQIRQAVEKYVATLGPVRQMEIHGHVADILTESGRLVYAEFEKKDGAWTFSRNLAEEFSKTMKDPDTQKAVLQHLGEKVSQRLQAPVTIKEGLDFRFELKRDLEQDKLLGSCTVGFAYPKVGEQQKRGQYVENFEWKDGRWRSWGPGALFDRVGP
jgi:hypothetical protein